MLTTVAGKGTDGGAVLLPCFKTSFVIAEVCVLLAFAAPGRPQATSDPPDLSQEFITIKVDGPLPPEAREALADLIEPEPVSQLIDVISESGIPLRDVCARSSCPELKKVLTTARNASVSRARTQELIMAPTIETVGKTPLLGATPGPPIMVDAHERYAVLDGNDPVVRAARRASADAAIAVPEAMLNESNLPLRREGLVIVPAGPAHGRVSVLEKDLEMIGSSERSYRLNRLLDEAKIAARVAVVRHSSPTSTFERTERPQETFGFIHFQTSGADCAEKPAHWPFNVAGIVEVMQFNEKLRERLKLGPVRRSRILIVDTGVGKTLAQTAAFNSILFADPAEIVAPASVQRQLVGDARCTDANGNGYWRDVYGAGSGPPSYDDRRCLNPSFDHLDLLQPYPRKATSKQLYNPDHGSFVGGLAIGGPKFLESFPRVFNYVGLSFFRVTRESQSSSLHVVNEFPDIALSLDYAAKIGADVINMSLKTARDEPFKPFRDNRASNTLLVASAGNFQEKLDISVHDNRPASLELGDQMIVVAALQPNESVPLWPDSARSPSRVHIAAPGAFITSFGAEGQQICDSGTSAAAPLVSFTAAMLRALTAAPRAMVWARVLAASDHLPKLSEVVEDGRRLNVEAALDVFVDRVELADGQNVIRGWIEPKQTEHLIAVCKEPGGSLAALRGEIDLALLWEWWKDQDGKAIIRHQLDEDGMFKRGVCEVPESSFAFFDLATGKTTDIQWRHVKKLLPTPFRGVKSTILKSNSVGEMVSSP